MKKTRKGESTRNGLGPMFLATILIFTSLSFVIIQPARAPPITWLPEIVDNSPDAGQYNSLAFDSAGTPHIAYRRSEPFPTAVLHAYKVGGVWYNETVYYDAGIVGKHVSIAIDTSDVIHISFYANDALYYATNASGIWVETLVDEDSMAIVGWHTSIDVDSINHPGIAYYDQGNARLKYAFYDGSSWNIDVVDGGTGGNEAGEFCSLAVAPDDTPHISYHFVDGSMIYKLKHAWKVGNSWNDEVVTDQDYPGRYSSIAVDDAGGIHISHNRIIGEDLMYSYSSGSGWSTQPVETVGDTGYYTSIALNTTGEPCIAYYDKDNQEIKRTWRESGSWFTESVAPCGQLSHHGSISIAMDRNDLPKISYYNATNQDLMFTDGFTDYIDLTVGQIWLDPSGPFEKGALVNIYANVTNQGTQDSDDFIVRIYDGDPAGGGTQIGTDQNVSSLSSGDYHIINVSWLATPTGTHFLYVEVNPDNAVFDPFQANDVNYTATDVMGPKLKLEPGWNLISIPLVQTNTSLPAVLDSISGDYDAVQFYNGSDSIKPWKHYQLSKPGSLNDLGHLNHIMGIWIHITPPGGTTLNVTGEEPSSPQPIILHPGWNMVGYPSLFDRNRTLALNNLVYGVDVDSIWSYNATTHLWKKIGPLDHFEWGRGYWIYGKSLTNITWLVPV